VAMASSFSASVASCLNNRIAARASLNASLAPLLVSFWSAPSITGSMVSSWVLKTDCAAWIRLAGSGDSSVKPPRAASTVRRRRLLRRTAAALAGMLATGADIAAFPGLLVVMNYSGALSAAFVGLGVVVAALLSDPVADQILGAFKLLRPCIAGNQARGLPHHVELAVAFDFANEDRLGDVMVRQHLRG